MSVYRVLLCKYEPREHILSERGVCLLKYLVVYRFFDTINCLSTNTQHRFFYAKTYRFLHRFSYRYRRGGRLPPAKMRSIFLYFYAEYNRGEAAQAKS